MELSFPIQDYLPILSEFEISFYSKILPLILLLPWFVLILFMIVKKILQYFATLKQKPMESTSTILPEVSRIPEERILKLKEIEKLALTNPREALFALSLFIRKVELKDFHPSWSLEFFAVQNQNHKRAALYSEIVQNSYAKTEPDPEKVLDLIREIRNKG